MTKKKNTSKKNNLKLIFCTSKNSWIIEYLKFFLKELKKKYQVKLIYLHKNLKKNNDIIFYLGYDKLVSSKYLSLSKINLVVHESDLPKDKGWSPVTWGVLKGKVQFTATLFKPNDRVDSGNFFLKKKFIIHKDCLIDEIRQKQFKATKYLINKFLRRYPEILKKEIKQKGKTNFLKKRTPKDSKININKSIISQFDHLRTLDTKRYPGWFILRGKRFKIFIDKFK